MIDTIALTLVLLGIAFIFLGLVSREKRSVGYEKYEDGFDRYGYGMREKEHAEREQDWEESRGRKVRGAGIIMIGPIPIILGDSKYAFYLGIIAIVLMVLSILLMFSFAGY